MNYQRGYSALVVAIIVSFIGIGVVLAISRSSYLSQKETTFYQRGFQAQKYAGACAELALDDIATNGSQTGTDTETFSNGSCTYSYTAPATNTRTIVATGVVGGHTKRIQVEVDISGNPLSTTNWFAIP